MPVTTPFPDSKVPLASSKIYTKERETSQKLKSTRDTVLWLSNDFNGKKQQYSCVSFSASVIPLLFFLPEIRSLAGVSVCFTEKYRELKMRRKELLCLVWAVVFTNFSDSVAGDAEPAILQNSPDLAHLRPFQSRLQPDPRPRLSSSQQQQILSDVQQHQRRYNQASQDSPSQFVAFPGLSRQTSPKSESIEQSSFPSLAKYRVDRTKQEQQKLQQQQQQQQQIVKNDGGINFLQTAATQRYQPQLRQQQLVNPTSQRFFDYQSNGQQPAPSESVFEEEQKIRLNEYYEKQRQLELLKKQREQLILEQREIKRQQELLKLQQIRQQTSTTRFTTAAPTSPTLYVTTSSPLLLSSPTARRITPAESELFLKAIATHQKKFTTTTTARPVPTTTTRAASPPKVRQERLQEHGNTDEIPKDLLSLIQAQQPQLLASGGKKPQIKIIYQTEKPTQTSVTSSSRSAASSTPSPPSLENELLLKQLKLALAQSADDDQRNVTTRDLVLPNGKKLQLIQSPNGLSSIVPNDGSSQFQTVTKALEATTSTTTIRPAKAILDELTKGVLPPGADFEVLRHKDDGKLEEVGKSPIHNQPGKKVTFVVLEEQPDGSYKVQGVKGNAKENGADVDSIVEKIKKGELKLPPRNSPNLTSAASSTSNVLANKETTTLKSSTYSTTYSKETNALPTTFRPTTIRHNNAPLASRLKESSSSSGYFPYVTVSPNSISSLDNYVTSASTTSPHVFNSLVNTASTPRAPTSRYEGDQISSRFTTASIVEPSRVPTYSTFAQFNDGPSTTSSPAFSTTAFPRTTSYAHFSSNSPSTTRAAVANSSPNFSGSQTSENLVLDDFQLRSTVPSFLESGQNLISQRESMSGLLRREGLFAMAKYLRQSGLDIVLNETGPYTIFVPTDKAFRTLLVQLGGPDKAEQKFRENPRLLSGLLLHHVIPGAFRMDTLQDEMTGVSLAGTQLRVNVYDMHDHEWNDVKVTTINGAKVAPNKRDIEIPQGIAHAIDRVMFPLPVGDLTQTLQADRERRFLTFLKILHASGLEDTLAGTKTFTVFAPTDTAFANAAAQNGRPVWIESDGPEAAKDIISRHIIPTTLYTGGMRYYHQRDTLRPQVTLSIQKNGGSEET
ncbi:uncharacterized protein [Venturia canescens]|uniref:uncharacterized protein isoform X2 n=1 Tax=Venturia canescens TaxID=32260 RepID=UPI001C9D358A|nr:uncharacterized protein LOC122414077 isoform X2 [Venturia canescens]